MEMNTKLKKLDGFEIDMMEPVKTANPHIGPLDEFVYHTKEQIDALDVSSPVHSMEWIDNKYSLLLHDCSNFQITLNYFSDPYSSGIPYKSENVSYTDDTKIDFKKTFSYFLLPNIDVDSLDERLSTMYMSGHAKLLELSCNSCSFKLKLFPCALCGKVINFNDLTAYKFKASNSAITLFAHQDCKDYSDNRSDICMYCKKKQTNLAFGVTTTGYQTWHITCENNSPTKRNKVF